MAETTCRPFCKRGWSRPLLSNGGRGGGGSLWGCLRTRQPTHPPTQTPPYPPPLGGGGRGFLCCKNQLVTPKPCVFTPKNCVIQSLCHR